MSVQCAVVMVLLVGKPGEGEAEYDVSSIAGDHGETDRLSFPSRHPHMNDVI